MADSHYSDLFRFATVRNPQLHTSDALRKRFVRIDVTPAQIAALSDASSLLLTTIPVARGQGNISALTTAVAGFYQSSPRRIDSVRDFNTKFPLDFASVEAWLRITPKPSLLNLTSELQAAQIVPATIVGAGSFVDDRVTLWENLIAQYFQPRDIQLREELIKRIRWFWMLQRIHANDPDLTTVDDVRSATRATVLLPDDMLPLPVTPAAPQQPPARGHSPSQPQEPAGKKIDRLESALNEVNRVYRAQDVETRATARAGMKSGGGVPASHLPVSGFTAKSVASLSANTANTLRSVGINHGTDTLASMRGALKDEIRQAYGAFTANTPEPRSLYIGGGIIHLDEVCTPFQNPDPCAKPQRRLPIPVGKGSVSSMGIADLRVVRTQLLKYEPGEIAHIENILLGETKKHTFRTLKRDEITDTQEEETTSEQIRDSQTTDRFELSQESSQVIKDDLKFDAGVTLSADLGSVKIGTTANFAMSTAKETSNKLATKQASEIVNKAVKRVVERRRHQRTTVSIVETDENDLHKLQNTKGPDNVSGIYTWVDKYYLAKVINYGKRLMLEFLVPEPAAFHIYSKTAKPAPEDSVIRPRPPAIAGPGSDPKDPSTWVPLNSFDLITPENVGTAAAPYDAAITPAPDPEVTVGVAIKSPDSTAATGDDDKPPIPLSAEVNGTLQVPTGYQATWATVQAAASVVVVPDQSWLDEQFNGKDQPYLSKPLASLVMVGNNRFDMNSLGGFTKAPMQEETGVIPVSVYIAATKWVVNVEVECEMLPDAYVRWQMLTFQTIMAAYQAKLKQYRDWLAQQEARASNERDGDNPAMNRATEQVELKKSAIEILTNQHFDAFDAMGQDPANLYPQIDIARAQEEGRYVQFFEQAFEWHNMTYLFYPYFWNEKPNWVYVKARADADPMFTKFLQAGYARVVVPVRDSYRLALLHYLESPFGEIWNGGDVPGPNDPMYVSIVDEFKEDNGDFANAVVEEAFEVKMPTSLVMLQSIKVVPQLPDNSSKLNWPPP